MNYWLCIYNALIGQQCYYRIWKQNENNMWNKTLQILINQTKTKPYFSKSVFWKFISKCWFIHWRVWKDYSLKESTRCSRHVSRHESGRRGRFCCSSTCGEIGRLASTLSSGLCTLLCVSSLVLSRCWWKIWRSILMEIFAKLMVRSAT